VVRIADPVEYDQVDEILSIAFGRERSKEVIDGFRRRSAEERQLAFLAADDEVPIGCVVAELCDNVIIYNLAVLPGYRREGVAAALVENAIEIIRREHRPASFWTAVHPERPEGIPRFTRLGFKEVIKEEGYLLMMRALDVDELPVARGVP